MNNVVFFYVYDKKPSTWMAFHSLRLISLDSVDRASSIHANLVFLPYIRYII